jgi:hypothetical protein
MVSNDTIALIKALMISDQVLMLHPDGQMPVVPTSLHHLSQKSLEPVLGRLAFGCKIPLPGFSPIVGKPNKVKYCRSRTLPRISIMISLLGKSDQDNYMKDYQ